MKQYKIHCLKSFRCVNVYSGILFTLSEAINGDVSCERAEAMNSGEGFNWKKGDGKWKERSLLKI
jgi:hypothetical protein